MENLKLSLKLLKPHIFILAILVMCIIVNFICITNIRKQTQALYEGPFAIKSADGILGETLEAMQACVYRAISNDAPDITAKAISEARERAAILQEQVAQLKQNALGDMGALSGLEANLSELAPMQEHVLALAAQNHNLEASAYMENNIIPLINEAQKELADFVRSAQAEEQELLDFLQLTQKIAIFFLIALCAVGAVFAVRDGTYFWRLYKGMRHNSGQYHPAQSK